MSEKPKQPNRIPFESLSENDVISNWSIPTVAKKSRPVLSAKREKENQKDQQGELIEDYKGTMRPKPLTAEDLKKLTDEAQQDGFDQGYKEGREKGEAEGYAHGEKTGQAQAYKECKQKLENDAGRLKNIAEQLLNPMQNQQQALEDIIVDMAVHFTQELLAEQIKIEPLRLINVISRALDALPAGDKTITVYCNQEDVDLIEECLPASQRVWRVSVDAAVTTGGCIIKTQESIVDYTVETRLKRFLDRVREQGDIDASELNEVPVIERPTDRSQDTEDNNLGTENTTDEVDGNEDTKKKSDTEKQDNTDELSSLKETQESLDENYSETEHDADTDSDKNEDANRDDS